MTDMKPKGFASESSQQNMEITQPLLEAQSIDLSSNHLDQQQSSISSSSEISHSFMEQQQSSDLSSNHMEQQQTEDNVTIDIEEIMDDKKEGLLSATYCLLSPIYCIYKVPPMIRKLKEDAYTPMAVSIGPFHYDDERLQEMEIHKRVLFERFIQKYELSLDEMVSFVERSEAKVRASYLENIKLNEKDLAKLVLVDAVFIIQLFTCDIVDDPKLSQATYLRETIIKDLVLLENQLPFFVIEELFNIAFPLDLYDDRPSFLDLTYEYFSYYNVQGIELDPNVRIKHFTDLLRLFHLPKKEPAEEGQLNEDIGPNPNVWRNHFTNFPRLFCLPRKEPDEDQPDVGDLLLYSATELQEAGLKFKGSSCKCLLDMKFSGRDLEIPKILVEDKTELLFRNMIALEQCLYPNESYITGYAFLMDCLINTNKDVDVLIHNQIMRNWLGDTNDVATLFNGLGVNTFADLTPEYLDLCKKLNKFYQNPWHKMKATVRREYCDTPWKTVGTTVGIIVLILTTTQTILSLVQAI